MEIEAKPTEYKGVLFRSKLEATWARFFDVIGVEWEYEPCQLPGWIPDFLIDGWWLAEVKPFPVTGSHAVRHEPFGKAIRDFDTVLLGEGPGDGLGLVVRRLSNGEIFTRHLLAYMDDGPAKLVPALAVPKWEMPLTNIWRGISFEPDIWEAVPFAKAVYTARDAFVSWDGQA